MGDGQGRVDGQVVVFTLGEPRYALHLAAVERVVRAVEVTPLPGAPGIIMGMISVHGQMIPVVDIGQSFGLPPRGLRLDDRFILARSGGRLVALAVESVDSIIEIAAPEMVAIDQLPPCADHLRGVAQVGDDLVLVCDLDRLLPFYKAETLDAVLCGVAT
jgi:purine-binding chemotaxis protein CheW